ncbi:MAG: hypothetical protein M3441_22590 [Chloroflexota bacterium]|nr:hypothetical protein [Chloroflexota bacterium]
MWGGRRLDDEYPLASDAALVSVELDPTRAEGARDLLGPARGVRVLQGDWRELLAYGPFDLPFADGGGAKEREPQTLVEALTPGGMVVLDDLTPRELWPEEWHGRHERERHRLPRTPCYQEGKRCMLIPAKPEANNREDA